MIVVDSSAWIEFYRPAGDADIGKAVAAALAEDQVAVNGIIQAEIVSFAPDKKAFEQLQSDFQAFHWLDLSRADFNLASQLGFKTRQHGFTVPATDLIIAASTIRAKAKLYHVDSHFEQIAKHSDLESIYLKK